MGIQSKLFIAFLSASILIVGAMYGFMQWSIDQGLLAYINQQEEQQQVKLAKTLEKYYAQSRNWSFIKENHQLWRQLNDAAELTNKDVETRSNGNPPSRRSFERPFPPPNGHRPPPRGENEPGGFRRPPPEFKGEGEPPGPPPGQLRTILLDENKQPIFGHLITGEDYPMVAIKMGNKTVGWLTAPPRKQVTDDFDLSFVDTQNSTYLLISLTLILISALLALPISARMVKPIKQLAKASHSLASGKFSTRVDEGRSDEIGQLTLDFNHLATTLEANESSRKRWIADISHELRTPLAVTRGELEAMLDGIRPLSQDSVKSAHQEVMHLQKLVEDLYELTNADIGALTYHMQEIDLSALIEAECLRFQTQVVKKSIILTTDIEEDLAINADETRITQLIHNLLQNSLKYTDEGGTISVCLGNDDTMATISINDTKPAVAEEDLDKLFDHLYRADASRNRKTGGSGLGLAISQRIVEGHNGNIIATHSPMGGLCIAVGLPLSV